MKNKILIWEIGSFFFIGLVGASFHFTYEFSNYSSNVVAYFSAVNESTWEHLKMVFFPALVFALVQYTYVREDANNYIVAKTSTLLIMPLVIIVGWYIYAPIVGRSVYPVDYSFLSGSLYWASDQLQVIDPPAARQEVHPICHRYLCCVIRGVFRVHVFPA